VFPLYDVNEPAGAWRQRNSKISGRMQLDRAAWWSQTGSNRRPPACKAGALPAELWPLSGKRNLVGLGRLELPTSRLSSARSNQLSYKPEPEDGRYRRTGDSGKEDREIVCRLSSVFHRPRSVVREERETKAAKSRKRSRERPGVPRDPIVQG
jgi:hypothetical protein